MKVDSQLIYAMFALVVLTFTVALVMVKTRVFAIKNKEMDPKYFKTFSLGTPTDAVLKTGRQFVNLFEVPVLFYVGCICAMLVPVGGVWIHAWAWFFVAARFIHAFVHITSNHIAPRMGSYVLSWIAVLAMWITIVVAVASEAP